jgi:hypothetical protein
VQIAVSAEVVHGLVSFAAPWTPSSSCFVLLIFPCRAWSAPECGSVAAVSACFSCLRVGAPPGRIAYSASDSISPQTRFCFCARPRDSSGAISFSCGWFCCRRVACVSAVAALHSFLPPALFATVFQSFGSRIRLCR